MDAVRTAGRRDALRATAAAQGLDAVLVTNLLNVRYLTGFTGSNGALLVRTDGADLFGTDGRYTTQAGTQVPDVELLVDRATVPALARAAVQRGTGRLGYESHDLTVDGLAALEKVLADAGGTVPELASVRRAVEAQRTIKDHDEIEALRRACAVADQALADLAAEGALRPGRSAPSAASSARARSATAQARRSASISASSLTARRPSTARRTLTSSGPAPPAAVSARIRSRPCRPSTVTSCDSYPSRPAPRRTASAASAPTVARSTSSSTSGTWMPACVV